MYANAIPRSVDIFNIGEMMNPSIHVPPTMKNNTNMNFTVSPASCGFCNEKKNFELKKNNI